MGVESVMGIVNYAFAGMLLGVVGGVVKQAYTMLRTHKIPLCRDMWASIVVSGFAGVLASFCVVDHQEMATSIKAVSILTAGFLGCTFMDRISGPNGKG